MHGTGLAAEPLLAGSMLRDEELGHVFAAFGLGDDEVPKPDAGEVDVLRVATGTKSVDDALGGGVCAGTVLGVWGDGGEVSFALVFRSWLGVAGECICVWVLTDLKQVCRMMLVDSLLKYPDEMAAVVDSTGNFDVLGVYTTLSERLKRNNGFFQKLKAKEEDSVEEVAATALDRVRIMRVFDFVGVREAIGEIRDGLERTKDIDRKTKGTINEPRQTTLKPNTPKRPTPEPLTPEPRPRRTAVADSEDEDEDEEMLFDIVPPSKEPAPAVQQVEHEPQQHPTNTIAEQEDQQKIEPVQPHNPIRFILIDNLAQVLTPLLKKDYIQGPSHPLPRSPGPHPFFHLD